jgi:DNA-3-methyladenine glycosylase II
MKHLLHLSKDRKLKKLIEQQKDPLIVKAQTDMVYYLCASIMSQQLSTKVANTIRQRFVDLFDGQYPRPEQILGTGPAALRAIGLSNSKVSYVLNVARFALEAGLDHKKLDAMDNEAVIAYLTQIKGVGRWTAEMLLMFGLGREDVFAIDDWGVQNAMIGIYKLDREDKKTFREEMLRIAAKWSPYRTYACMYLWRWKANSPIAPPKAAPKTPARAKVPKPAR